MYSGYNPYAYNPYLYGNAYSGAGYGSGSYDTAGLYTNPYYDPIYGAFQGLASLTDAEGRFLERQQSANLKYQQVRSARTDNRRKVFDQYLYEKSRTPTPEEAREAFMHEQVARARNNPPLNDIISGKSLNDLLADLKKLPDGQVATLRTLNVPLDEESLKHVNFTANRGAGNVGLLKNEGRLNWPVALSLNEFKDDRQELNSLAQEAVRQAEYNSQVDPGTLRRMMEDSSRMRAQLRAGVGDMPPALYIEGTTFLNNLDDAIRALQQPGVGNFFSGKYKITAKTIPDLVKFMIDHGLQFAPAVPGDEPAYLALHQSLAAYDSAVKPMDVAQKETKVVTTK
jgi:hypothetical protein